MYNRMTRTEREKIVFNVTAGLKVFLQHFLCGISANLPSTHNSHSGEIRWLSEPSLCNDTALMSGHFSPTGLCWGGGGAWEGVRESGTGSLKYPLLEGEWMFRYSSLGNGVRATSQLYKLCAPALSDLKFLRPQRGQLGVRC